MRRRIRPDSKCQGRYSREFLLAFPHSPDADPRRTVTLDHARSFPPIATAEAHTLILGSMPGRDSLRATQYYAHPRNAFWPIVTTLLGSATTLDYAARIELLRSHGFALWDVLASCTRPGSLDTAIDPASIVPNNFAAFFAQHPHIDRVFFNGAAAATLYRRHVLPTLDASSSAIASARLPSTSPAHAGRSFAAKLDAWRAILPG